MTTQVMEILLSIALAVFSGGIGILTIYLKKRWGVEDFRKVLAIVEEMVKAAELVGAAKGWDSAAKKKMALEWAAERTGLSEAELSAYVEAAVATLKSAGEELTKKGQNIIPKP